MATKAETLATCAATLDSKNSCRKSFEAAMAVATDDTADKVAAGHVDFWIAEHLRLRRHAKGEQRLQDGLLLKAALEG